MTTFAQTSANLQVSMAAKVTDPLGGYDINVSTLSAMYARVTLNLTSPAGSPLLVKQRMNLLSGGQLSFQNLFRLNYTLTSTVSGQYNFTVIATDNSGNVALGNGSFNVGQVSAPITSTLAFQLGTLLLILVILAAGGGYMVNKRRKGKSTPKASQPSST